MEAGRAASRESEPSSCLDGNEGVNGKGELEGGREEGRVRPA